MKMRHIFGAGILIALSVLLVVTPAIPQPQPKTPQVANQTQPAAAVSAAAAVKTTVGELADVVFQQVYPRSGGETELLLVLRRESYLNASTVARTVQEKLGAEGVEARALGSFIVQVRIPQPRQANAVDFAAALQPLTLVGPASVTAETNAPVDSLVELLSSKSEPAVRMNAAMALSATGSVKARQALAGYASSDPDPWVRRCVAVAVARLDKSVAENIEEAREGYLNELREAIEVLKSGAAQNDKLAQTVKRLEEHLRQTSELYPVGDEIVRLQDPQTRDKVRTLLEVINKIRAYYPDDEKTKIDDLVTAAANGLTEHLDRFSKFMSAEQNDAFKQSFEGGFVGIGIHCTSGGEYPMVDAPIYDGPAFKAGILSNDRITTVGGESTKGFNSEMLAAKVRGEPGTQVTLGILRPGWDKPRDFVVTRQGVVIPPVAYEVMPGSIGYIRIAQFGTSVPEGLDEALAYLKDHNALSGLVIDLRNNPGGMVEVVQRALSRFLEPSTLVITLKGKSGQWAKPQEIRTLPAGQVKVWSGFPIVVLVNSRSASGSEMMAGALQDWGRAVVVGETTYGKGCGQFTMPLVTSRGENFLHLTVFKYYLPKGESIHEKGVKPDVAAAGEQINEETYKEMGRIKASDALADYVLKWFGPKRELFGELIATDGRDASRYPSFDKLYEKVDTKLGKSDVRIVVRNYLRGMFADERRAPFLTDVQEDKQLQQAVREIASRIGLKLETIPLYFIFASQGEVKPTP